jgi:outer membrane protein TolC
VQEAQTRAISAELRPEIMASATLSGREGGAPASNGLQAASGYDPKTANWDAGLILSWPIFDQSVRARAETSARLEQARRSELDDLEARLRSTVQQVYVALDAATQALPTLEKAVLAGRANYDQANARFKAGLGTAVELADAQDLLAAAEVNLALGRFEYARARVHLGRVIVEEP